MVYLNPKKKTKSPPILSHEFVITNHADILSCVLMVFIASLYFQVSAKFGTTFISLNHNHTVNKTFEGQPYEDYNSFYTTGVKDYCFVFFYFITLIIYHAVIQEYILDKSNRKLHLSKVKTNKFNESGGLLAFYLPWFIFGSYIISNGYIKQLGDLWHDYPTTILPWNVKLFFLLQIATWLHFLPELYFQKIPKEEWKDRIIYVTLYATFIALSYYMSFTKVALPLLMLQYFEQIVYHCARIVYFTGKSAISKYGFIIWNVVFVVCRLLTAMILILTFQIGLPKSSIPIINLKTKNFNTPGVRLEILVTFGLLQAWLMYKFLDFHIQRWRENSTFAPQKSRTSPSHTRKQVGASNGALSNGGAAGFLKSLLVPSSGTGANPASKSAKAYSAAKQIGKGHNKIVQGETHEGKRLTGDVNGTTAVGQRRSGRIDKNATNSPAQVIKVGGGGPGSKKRN